MHEFITDKMILHNFLHSKYGTIMYYSPSRRWIRTPASALNAALNKDAVSGDHTSGKSCKLCALLPWLEMIPCPLRGDPQEGHSLLWYSFPKLKTKLLSLKSNRQVQVWSCYYNRWSSIAWDLQFHKENRTAAEDMTTKCDAVV